MGIGKAVIAVILISVLSYVLLASFSMAYTDKTTDIQNTSTNATVLLSQKIGSTSAGYMPVLIIVAGVLCFAAMIFIFRRVH